jgi:hypothetical protein
MPRPKVILKPGNVQQVDENSRFHIDYGWWEQENLSLESYLNNRLGQTLVLDDSSQAIDLVDMRTGEVRQLSGFEFAVQYCFQQMPEGFMQRASLVDAVFYALLANGNRPMTAAEISAEIGRPADTIFKTLGTGKVYQGIRLYQSL